uniref:RING-type domain-containing protein n=1 Tax=Chromera velia CCMP2878 TaxID=1169474 RepID=A0A0G4I841_9ALVE|eukprot:Cvel_11850.t1-p1 / transcript=Cvel_11850.t1 / gene=Cvel_11850 / organism=Chromera_velia_CCMP2878 / gene_product=TNF receptor-associated factor 5, putative / transcript_product=TNF receptor-associated factor 5, putative / location=Cvel_scaffold755:66281-66928(-) / protein_length=216 / sequence_SO=supercontig / SO=protein_coding / is_pseudo=false
MPGSSQVSSRRLGLDVSFAADGFEKQVEKALCPICFEFPEDPREVDCQARHVFCAECIQRVQRLPWSKTRSCPTCRGRFLKVQKLKPYLQGMLDEIRWRCVNFQKGCTFTGNTQQLVKHLDEECLDQETGCPSGCGHVFPRKSVAHHTEFDCPFISVACMYCTEEVLMNRAEQSLYVHLKTCKKVPVLCPNRCGQTVPRDELPRHVQSDNECAYVH